MVKKTGGAKAKGTLVGRPKAGDAIQVAFSSLPMPTPFGLEAELVRSFKLLITRRRSESLGAYFLISHISMVGT